MQYALIAIISGVNGYYAGRSQIARIYEVFPLLCPMCGGQMRLIPFVTVGTQIQKILNHIGVDSEPPHIAPARGPPLGDDCDAQTGALRPVPHRVRTHSPV